MNCVLKMELNTALNEAQEALERFDEFLKERYTEIQLNPPVAFMSAWHKVKSAKQQLLSIYLEGDIK